MSSADEKLIETLFGDSSKLWETTFNGINDSVLLLNPEGLILLANKISYNLFQKNEGEIVGKRCYEIVHNTNCHIDGCALVKMKLSKQREKTLLPFADKWFEVTVDPILDNENNLIAAVHIVSDVTERKKTEVALANSNKLLADSQKIGKVGGWEFNIDTLEQTWTEETCRIHEVELGYKPDVEEGIDFYLPASRPIIKRAVRNAIEKGESFDLELEIFTANKNLKWVHTIGNADLINRRVYGFFQDITDQKKIELKLKESETKFKSLYNSIPIPTYTWKIVGNEFFLLQYNDEAESIHYSSIKERIGMTAGELYYDSSEILFDLNLCYKEQSSFQKELIYNDKSNNEYKYLYLKYAFVGPDLVIIHVENITERKKSEEALRESENKYHGLFDTMQEFVIVVDVVNDSNGNPYDFKYLSLNKSAERLTGLTEEKVVGRTYREIEKNINEDVIITVGEVAQRRQPAIREWYSYPTKRWLMQHLYSVNSGQVVFLGIDITKRKLMEDSLKESQEKFRGLSEASFESIFISEKGICVEQNIAAERTFGYTSKEAIGRMGTEWIIPQDRELVMKNMISGIETPYEATALRKDGTTFPCILRGKMMHYKGKDVRITSLRDITERKKREDEIKLIGNQYKTLFEKASEGILFLSDKGDIINLNDAFAKMHGYSLEEMMQMNLRDLETPEMLKVLPGNIARVMAGETIQIEAEHYHKDGHIIYLAVSSSLIVMNNMSYIQAFHRDISEQKKTEKILKLANSNLVTAELVAKTGSWKFSLEGKMVDISVGFKKIFGTEKSVLSIDEVRDFRLPEYQSALDETIKMLVEGQEIVNTEYKIKRLTDGAIIDVQAIAKYDSISHTMYGTVQDITERKKVEDELRFQSEITANLTDAIYLFKVENGEIVFSNTNFEKMFGYASKELNGQTVSILNAPDSGDPTETAKTIIESIKKNGSWKGEIENIKKDGTVFWCYANIKLFKHSTYGNICLTIHTDISNKKKIEKALFESNKNLKLSEFIAKLGHWKMNLDTRIFYVSDGAQKIYGLNKTEVLLEEVQSFRLPEYNSMMDEALSALIEEDKPYDIEFKIKRSNDGEIIDVHSIIEYDSNNRILFGVIQDITERKLAEQLLKYSENNLSAIFNNTNTGFILLDEQFKIVSLNKRAKELTILALDKEPVVNESIIEILPDEKQEAFSRNLYDVLLGNEIHYDINYPQKDGSPLWLDIACKPVFNEQSKIIGISYAITDLTKRKTAEKDRDNLITELLDKNNNLMQFNYIVSHNLRSPVSNLIGLSNLLKIPSNTEEEKLKIFEHIQQAALNMDILIKDLNTILSTRSIIDKQNENINIPDLIVGISNTLERELKESESEIELNFSDEANDFISVKSYIESIFYNLISNAIKYRSNEGKHHIVISTKKEKNIFHFTISDNGKGIDLEKNGKYIFGLYKRFHSEVEGKGLGLHMVKTQVEALGGHISVESEVEKGTTFKITLPCHL